MSEQTILESNALTNSINRNNALRKRIILERRKSFPEQTDTIQHVTEHQRSSLHDIEEVSLCVCQQSKNFPICDNTHELFDLNIQPMVVGIPKRLLQGAISTKRPLSRSENNVDHNIVSSCGKNCSRTSENDGCSTHTNIETDSVVNSNHIVEDVDTTLSSKSLVEPPSSIAAKSPSTPSRSNNFLQSAVDRKTNPETYTLKEVSQHCTAEDCWIVFYDKVYDVTPYFGFHPGGERALLKFAGKDGSENVEFHSKQMMILLDKYFFVGNLRKEDVTHPPPNQCIII